MKHAQKRPVPFCANVPEASDVRITGDFTGWSRAGIPLWNEGDGTWRTILSLLPGVYEYLLVVDGVLADHGEAAARVSNPLGAKNCILTVQQS